MKKIIISVLSALVAFSSIAAAEATVMAEQTEKQSKKAKAELKDVTFNVHLHCHSCVKKIQENIAFEKGVKDLKVCLEDQIVSIKYDSAKTNEETLKNALVKLGIKVTGKSESGHNHTH
jgi:copper chaperone CopZ